MLKEILKAIGIMAVVILSGVGLIVGLSHTVFFLVEYFGLPSWANLAIPWSLIIFGGGAFYGVAEHRRKAGR